MRDNQKTFGLYLVVIGAIAFLCLSIRSELNYSSSMLDFRTAYCSARCLLQHSDPYKPADMLRVYREVGADRPSDSDSDRFAVSRNNYFPTEFAITVPFALFPFRTAEALWMTATAGSFILAAFLMWNLASQYAPELAGWLLCFLLVNAEQAMLYGNAAGLSIGLCAIACWCFLRGRFEVVGVLCLAASLALKPHDAGLVWLYFLLTRGAYRIRALQTLLVFAVFSLPAVLWLTHVAPHWIAERNFNWSAFSVHGGAADPGPAAFMSRGTAPNTDLQSVFSVFRDDPAVYNPATYLICAPLLLAWIAVTVRARVNQATAWLGLAAVAPMSMLFTYHRIYDAKLIMLTVPACALLWAERGRVGRLALIIGAIGVVLTGDLVWSTYFASVTSLHAESRHLISAALGLPLPLSLLLMSTFYLWVYAKRALQPAPQDLIAGTKSA